MIQQVTGILFDSGGQAVLSRDPQKITWCHTRHVSVFLSSKSGCKINMPKANSVLVKQQTCHNMSAYHLNQIQHVACKAGCTVNMPKHVHWLLQLAFRKQTRQNMSAYQQAIPDMSPAAHVETTNMSGDLLHQCQRVAGNPGCTVNMPTHVHWNSAVGVQKANPPKHVRLSRRPAESVMTTNMPEHL